jgi:hypothetical protein
VLSVESKTARNLLPTLRAINLIDHDGAPTSRANEWRVEEEYPEVCRQIRGEIYPERLIHTVPDPDAAFGEAVQWFMRESGVGEPAAKRMARFYSLLTEADPAKGGTPGGPPLRIQSRPPKRQPVADAQRGESQPPVFHRILSADSEPAHGGNSSSPVHLTVNIHLSPEMSSEQIDELFASMARHLVHYRS